MFPLGTFITAAAIVSFVVCDGLASAADSPSSHFSFHGARTAVHHRPKNVGNGAEAAAENGRQADMNAKARDERLLEQAHDGLTVLTAQAEVARDTFAALTAKAGDARQEAYAISNAPGLSADQNRNSIVAMEAADAAESTARAAQVHLDDSVEACVRERAFIDGINARISDLDHRIAASAPSVAVHRASSKDVGRVSLPAR